MANANEFVITEHRCEMCKSYGPAAECTMNIKGKVIARFWLCIGCQKEMLETYKDVLNKYTNRPIGRFDCKRFVEEGLEKIISRIMRDYIHESVAYKGEEK